MDKTVNIFISYEKRTDYKLAFKLRNDKIITIIGDLFEQSNLIKIEFLLANSVLEYLQYDFNKYAGVSLFKSHFIRKIKVK